MKLAFFIYICFKKSLQYDNVRYKYHYIKSKKYDYNKKKIKIIRIKFNARAYAFMPKNYIFTLGTYASNSKTYAL